jgi:hypothetical protein
MVSPELWCPRNSVRGRKTSLRVILTSEERNELERRLRWTTTRVGLARRCRVILGWLKSGKGTAA